MAVLNKDEDKFVISMKKYLRGLEDKWDIVLLEPDLEGVKVVEI
jgi:homoserine kinase